MPGKRPELRRRKKGRWIGRGESRSITGHVLESLESGTALPAEEPAIPEPESDLVRMGDPDVDALQNEYTGDESPGASTPTPDQNLIDATGRAYGVGNLEGGALRSSSEVLDKRDRRSRGPRNRSRRQI